jgi:hypothetical protein
MEAMSNIARAAFFPPTGMALPPFSREARGNAVRRFASAFVPPGDRAGPADTVDTVRLWIENAH